MTIFETIRDEFKSQLVRASNGEKTSLPFLKISLPSAQKAPQDPYQVVTVGGTNFFSAMVSRDDDGVKIRGQINRHAFPLFQTGEDVLRLISFYLEKDTRFLVVNFAFPLKAVLRNGRPDGIILPPTKGHRYADLTGLRLGEEIERYVFKRFGRKITVSVANDTVCLVLAGVTIAPRDRLVAVIVGTGYNMGFFLDNNTVINLEASCLSPVPRTESGLTINASGIREFETEVCGRELYLHFNYYVENGEIKHERLQSTKELFEIAFGREDSDAQRRAKTIVESSAWYVASQIAGMAEFKGSSLDIVIEGALCGAEYLTIVQEKLQELTKFKVNLHRVEHSSLVGGAYLI